MSRLNYLLITVLMVCGLTAISAAASGLEPVGVHAKADVIVIRISPADAAHLLTRGVSEATHGIKLAVHTAPRLAKTVRHEAVGRTGGAQLAVHGVAERMQDSYQQYIREVRTLSLHLLRSVFSIILGLLSGLLRS